MTGQYLCTQGWTELTLEVTSSRGSTIEAVFDFVYRPRSIAGRFRVRGTRSASGEIELRPVEWITRPSNWVMVGMRGRVGADGVFRGRITEPQCGEFFVTPS
jgi:hypothetical protein